MISALRPIAGMAGGPGPIGEIRCKMGKKHENKPDEPPDDFICLLETGKRHGVEKHLAPVRCILLLW